MNSLMLSGRRRFSLGASPDPEPGEGEAVLRVEACAVCRTDAVMWDKGHRDLLLPRVPGHEICGRVYGAAPSSLQVVWPGIACGSCDMCRIGRENLCRSMRIIGFHRDGGFADCLVVPEANLLPVPSGITAEVATLAEPFGCALHALDRSRLRKGERVLIYGGGTLGILLALGAVAQGAEVLQVDPDLQKLEKGRSFRRSFHIGGGSVIDGQDAQDFNVVINATSACGSFSDGIHRLAPGGRYCLFSGLRGNEEYPASLVNEIHYREADLVGSYGCTRQDMRAALELLVLHEAELSFLIESRISLEQVQSVMPTVLEGKGFKFVITF